jgi:osmotically-inducible protein OsmY
MQPAISLTRGGAVANQPPNGGRSAVADDNGPSWRPQDPSSHTARGREADDDRGDQRGDQRPWRDRSYRDDERRAGEREPRRWETGRGGGDLYHEDRDHGRSTERHGQGQSGYSAGRHGDDRSQQLVGRNDMMPSAGSFEDRYRDDRYRGDLGTDDRFTGRGRPGSWQERTGYDLDRYGGQGGRDFEAERRGLSRGGQGGGQVHDEGLSYPAGSYSRAGGGHAGYGGSGTQDTMQRGSAIDPHIHRGTGPHRGKGPSGYQRSDDRIRELVCESLADDDQLDATHIEVAVSHGEVTLSGTIDDRRAKRDAEDCAWSVSGVRDVQNMLRVARDDQPAGWSKPSSPAGQASVGSNETETPVHDKKHRA